MVCTATSTITVTSSEVAALFDQGYFIGQVVRKMHQTPAFKLLDVGLKTFEVPPSLASGPGSDSDGELSDSSGSGSSTSSSLSPTKQRLWRKYVLGIDGLECNIEEVFVDRDMFLTGNVPL